MRFVADAVRLIGMPSDSGPKRQSGEAALAFS